MYGEQRQHQTGGNSRQGQRDARSSGCTNDIANGCSEREADAHLARALRHRLRDKSVDAERGEKHSEPGEGREQNGLIALFSHSRTAISDIV
jgi:hypothetical protein